MDIYKNQIFKKEPWTDGPAHGAAGSVEAAVDFWKGDWWVEKRRAYDSVLLFEECKAQFSVY